MENKYPDKFLQTKWTKYDFLLICWNVKKHKHIQNQNPRYFCSTNFVLVTKQYFSDEYQILPNLDGTRKYLKIWKVED